MIYCPGFDFISPERRGKPPKNEINYQKNYQKKRKIIKKEEIFQKKRKIIRKSGELPKFTVIINKIYSIEFD